MPGFVNNGDVMNMGTPDVCMVGPAPVTYVNISETAEAEPAAPDILVEGTPVQNLLCMIDMSDGDAGVGVASGMCMGPTIPMIGSFTVLMEASPVTTMMDMTMQNLSNCVGMFSTQGQVTLTCLSS